LRLRAPGVPFRERAGDVGDPVTGIERQALVMTHPEDGGRRGTPGGDYQANLVQRPSQQGLECGHGLRGLNGGEPRSGKAGLELLRGDNANAAPVTPVHDLDSALRRAPDVSPGEGIFEGAARDVIALARVFEKGSNGGEEQHEVEGFVTKDLGET